MPLQALCQSNIEVENLPTRLKLMIPIAQVFLSDNQMSHSNLGKIQQEPKD
jgi:hypothetical protein